MSITNRTAQALVLSMKSFIQGTASAEDFKSEFMSLWRQQRDCEEFQESELSYYEAIDSVFTALDCYCPDESVRDAYDIDEYELRKQVMTVLQSLGAVQDS